MTYVLIWFFYYLICTFLHLQIKNIQLSACHKSHFLALNNSRHFPIIFDFFDKWLIFTQSSSKLQLHINIVAEFNYQRKSWIRWKPKVNAPSLTDGLELVILLDSTKGQEISEWIYEVVALPIICMNEKLEKLCPEVLGWNFSIFLFIFWAMRWLHIFILKFPDLY